VVAVVALSDGDEEASAPGDLSLADLEPALLTEEDVGGDYTLDPGGGEGDDDGDSLDMEGGAGSDECRELMDTEESGDTNEEVGVEFVDDSDSMIGNTLGLLLPGEPTLDEVRAALEQCDTMTFEDEGATGEFRITVEDVEGLGDDAIGVDIVLDVEVEGLSLTIDSYGLLWAHDGVAADLFLFGGLDETTLEPTVVDEARVRDLAQTVDGRITEIVGG
jgi:hypothetical protein